MSLIIVREASMEDAFSYLILCCFVYFSFQQVFDKTMKKKLYDRLLYIFCSQVKCGAI